MSEQRNLPPSPRGWEIGVDVGGTFTDFCVRESPDGAPFTLKCPSTPDDPARAVLEGLEALAAAGIPIERATRLQHGTTVATNALIERRGGRVALVTTRGFRDLLEIGRQTRPHMYDLRADHPPPVVPRELRLELDERVTARGTVLRAPRQEAVRALCSELRGAGVEAIAVCLLFSFESPAHEQLVAEVLREAMPDTLLSLSCEVRPEFREYERFSTTALNAYLQPVMARYLAHLEQGLESRLPGVRVHINQSNGGLMSPPLARRFPVRTALSGPAAGVVGALASARRCGRLHLVTFDMGGTSTDVALVENGRVPMRPEREVAGFPVRTPAVDIDTVGAGGGSICWVDRDGLLKVGPRSAGATPGPACYPGGGAEPTVTDANLILGRLGGGGLAGGSMPLDPAASRRAFAPIARELGFDIEHTALGALGVVVSNMVRAIRTISVERGKDPRPFTLAAYGGAGPLHAREVAASLGIREILVPDAPGVVCALGLLAAEQREDLVRAVRIPLEAEAEAVLEEVVAALRADARRWFTQEGIGEGERRLELELDMRHMGQNFELAVAVPPARDGKEREGETRAGPRPSPPAWDLDPARLRARFLEAHEGAYGFRNPHDPVEIVHVRLIALGAGSGGTPEGLREAPSGGGAGGPARWLGYRAPGTGAQTLEVRPVWFSGAGPVPTPVIERATLSPGTDLEGPAVIEQPDATTLVFPGDRLEVDASGNLLIRLAPGDGAAPRSVPAPGAGGGSR